MQLRERLLALGACLVGSAVSPLAAQSQWFYPGLGYKDWHLPDPTLVELGVGFSRDRNVKLKFYLINGSLCSFWVTPSAQGASYGYVAASGPGFTSAIDRVGGALGRKQTAKIRSPRW